MLSGGIADKLGNEYEFRWTLVEALRLLQGLADELRIEPFNENANGLEFRITKGAVDHWHQCKRRRDSGSWTVRSLETEGILAAFARKLSQPNAHCVFVSSDPAPDIKRLTEKARIAQLPNDFYGEGGVGKADQRPLQELSAAWGVDPPTLFQWLKRCLIEVTSENTLYRQLQDLCGLLFKTPPDHAIDRLIQFLSRNLGQRLTAASLSTAIDELGIKWRAHLDQTLDVKVELATNEFLASLPRKVAGLNIHTAELDLAVHTAISGDRPITIVAGGAGSGKSVVVSRVVDEARARGWPVLAFRIDRYLEIQTLSDLGNALIGNDDSPVASFGNRNITEPSLLVIDQVDAVSEASGRSGRMRDLFFRMIDHTAHFPNMRVVAACRSYDLNRDTRLEELSQALRVSSLTLKPLNWQEGVQPLLGHLSLKEQSFTEREKEVLSIPINLQLFASIVKAGEHTVGEITATRLFDKLIDVREQDFRKAGCGWTAISALGVMARSMSENQELTAPLATLDQFPGAVDFLSSHGLITAIGGKLQFAHESFFDHTFSRHFVATGQSVYALLVSDEQRLFRRTQVRQIFSRLRDNNELRCLFNLREVMGAENVRYLVKDAIAYWLSEVDAATVGELEIVEEWFEANHPLEQLSRVVFSGRGWLARLQESGRLDLFVQQGGAKKELAFWLLKKWAADHSALAATFMKKWWLAEPDKRSNELIAWFERLYPDGPIDQLEALYGEVIRSLPTSAVKMEFATNFELGSWAHKGGATGARILGLWLSKWMQTYPNAHPFSDEGNQSHLHWVQELAKHRPTDFLQATIPLLFKALAREKTAYSAGTLAYKTITPPQYEHDQEYLRAILQALEIISLERPDQATEFLESLGDDNDVAVFARLRAIAANGQAFSHLLVPLLRYDGIFKVAEGDSDWLPFATAAAAAMPYLSGADRKKVEDAVLAYRPEYDWALEYLRRSKKKDLFIQDEEPGKYIIYQLSLSGRDRRAILKTIGSEWLSDSANQHLIELDRKFAGQALPEASGILGGWVRSPIEPAKAIKMSDAQWLRAIKKYDGSERRVYERDGVIGGVRQLSGVLQSRAKEEPGRFVALLERFPPSVRAEYVEAVIGGLRESEADGALLAGAIKASRVWSDGGFNRITNWAIQRHPSAASDPGILAYLLESAECGATSDTAVTTTGPRKSGPISAQEFLRSDSDLVSSGINGERGAAYEALATVLWENPSPLSLILDLLERRVDSEPLASVGICMVHTLNSVGKYEPDRAIDLFKRLVSKDVRVMGSHTAEHILTWIVHRRPDVVAELVDILLKSESIAIQARAYFLESLLALLDNERDAAFTSGFAENPLRRQMAAFRAAANITSRRHGDRCEGWLIQLFYDEDAQVRRDTIGIDWGMVLDANIDRTSFIRAFLSSPAFDNHSDALMRALESRVSQLPDLTFDAVDRVLELSGGWKHADRPGHFSTLHHLSRVLVELYRSVQVGSAREKRILDLFDAYLARDLHDMRGEIRAYERH